ncbi:MAG TPA: hypothetical protein VF855_03610 [Acidimicrobiales bacterium]
MRFVALLVGLIITGVMAVVVLKAMSDSTNDTLSEITVVSQPTTEGSRALPGPGGGPLVLDTVPQVVQPGVGGVIDAAAAAACSADRKTFDVALEAYTSLEGSPPRDEKALVDRGYLRELSPYWNLSDGKVVAEDPRCK